MHPAYSVIFFTTLSGAGYGLIIWIALARLQGYLAFEPKAGVLACLVALALISAGLLSSTLHLGHPERAWRSFSQWRSSWLSREGVVAVLTYAPALVFTASWIPGLVPAGLASIAAAITVLLSVVTVLCTGMIYASLKTIPRWHNPWVVPVYLAFALASGGLLFALALSGSGQSSTPASLLILGFVLMAWLIKMLYWRFIGQQKVISDKGSATGLGVFGEVSQLEAPHTSENYLLKEMGYRIARKHAGKLRRYAILSGLIMPALLVLLSTGTSGLVQIAVLSLALLSGYSGLVIERWLFFAEARHAVTLYYGRTL
jgi:DMSO reductase anchor subunit